MAMHSGVKYHIPFMPFEATDEWNHMMGQLNIMHVSLLLSLKA